KAKLDRDLTHLRGCVRFAGECLAQWPGSRATLVAQFSGIALHRTPRYNESNDTCLISFTCIYILTIRCSMAPAMLTSWLNGPKPSTCRRWLLPTMATSLALPAFTMRPRRRE